MDGLLINTEDLYTVAHNSMLAEHGKGPMPWSVKITLMGLPGTESAKRFLAWSGLPYTPEEYYAETTRRLEELFPTAEFLPGARELLTYLDLHGVPIALATSSHAHTFRLKTGHLHDAGFAFFKKHIVTGDDKRVAPGRGKPHPDIWYVALESLNKEMLENHEETEPIKIEECLVFEDGVPGVTAGIAAGATVVWVPDERAIDAMGNDKAEELISGHGEILKSLKDLDLSKYGL
ncbi:uncharacterized protein SAPINGB_P001314 [Magnusiomyces paraingens]|uniref:Uncharacterized protein n=1 Tax=Magnusiomyces paraingens TaxID=2606893 RepID=A0A5E8B530_9ASCO|nr:uncharacterized protein SAPINGB_P001314 [Saprochaete ingens]VVT46640.1 unnamed protein product [Saprochaete ingens]